MNWKMEGSTKLVEESTDGCIDRLMDIWKDGRMDEWIDTRMDDTRWMDGWMDR